MPSDISEPRGGDIRTTPEQKQSGFMKTNPVPESGGDRSSNVPQQSSFSEALPSAIPNGRTAASDSHWESSLFSSSFSEIFSRKLRLPRSDNLSFMPAYPEEEPSESLQEMEAQTIGNLLPDEDDFFEGVVGHNSRANGGDDLDDDLFSSVGGMELDGDVFSSVSQRAGKRGNNVFVAGEPHRGEVSSRVLFVTNMDSIIEDYELRALFEQYGDVRALHTAGKNRGFIMVSYYDIRAAQNAMRALHGRLLRGRKLDIHYHIAKENSKKENTTEGALLVNNLDSSVSSEEFYRLVSSYGEIREVRRTMPENSQIYVEFFDVRAAEAAYRGLNGLEIAGRQLKLAPSFQEGTSFTPQFAADVDGGLPKIAFNNLSSTQIGRHYPGILASTSINGGSLRMMHNSVGSPVNSFTERHQCLDIPVGTPPSTRIMSASKPVGLQEFGSPFDNSKTGIQSMPNLHPHSFHEYFDNFASGSPYKSSTTFSEMNGQKANEGFMMSNVRGVGVDGFNGGVIGSPVNQGSHRANPNLWSNSNPQQLNPSNGTMWPNSPSRVNGVASQRIPAVTAFSRASPLMVNMASSPVHQHIGSAPVLNSPFWDRRQTYVADSPETSGFHFGSHGSMGFPGSSPSHAMEMASHKGFSHVGGNRMDANSSNGVSRSSRQMPHYFSGRSSMLSVPGSFDLPNERYRNLSQRRSEFSSNNAEKKLFELDVDRILRGEDSRTTLMIKNIPNKYTSKMLLAAIDEHCKGTYDFLYLPIDFKNKCNVGYAFINLTKPENIVALYKAFNGNKWEKFNSEKVASLAYGRIQGKSALIAHFQNSSLMNEDKRCRPILFHTAGPNAGDQEPFPMGTNIRSRPGKHRTSSVENYNTNFSSSSENREEPPNGTDSF
ncbi:unnamed protein product [Eruca vesicaria subsp. sativa]|uniref:RRM domain-containing protein n=1 Tax=Eruca vesicaria subsp. sativa TaxID=29727 RepID=A0ABC8J3L9_ERUVS|nr:unnamed protein product [Eruca vesicaria subsp. sativa]